MLEQIRSRAFALGTTTLQGLRRIRGLGPLVIVALLIVAMAGVLSTFALQHGKTQAATTTAALVIARADFHSETIYKGEELEMNIVISQIGNDCQAALNGGFCLRYSVVLEEQALMVGYGVIPASDV